MTSFAPALNEFGSSIADIFGFDDSKITSAIDALGGLGQTASGVGQIMSGDIVGGAMSAVSGISSVVSALDGMFGADYSHYNEMVEEYTRLNEIWDELIDKKQEYISISYGMEADKVGEEALGLVESRLRHIACWEKSALIPVHLQVPIPLASGWQRTPRQATGRTLPTHSTCQSMPPKSLSGPEE